MRHIKFTLANLILFTLLCGALLGWFFEWRNGRENYMKVMTENCITIGSPKVRDNFVSIELHYYSWIGVSVTDELRFGNYGDDPPNQFFLATGSTSREFCEIIVPFKTEKKD